MKSLLRFLAITGLCSAAAINYTYDSAGRLIKVDYGNGSVITYVYDNAGNLTSRSVTTSNAGPLITSVTTASGGSAISQNDWIVIKGSSLVPSSTPASGVIWSTAPSFANGQLPTQLSGVSVTVNGKAAYVYFFCSAATSTVCTSDQINVLTPLDNTTGPVPIVVTSGTTASPAYTATLSADSPAFLTFNAQGYVAATHTNGTLVGPITLYPGSSTPAKSGETIVTYAVGFGLPSGTLTSGSSSQTGSLSSLPVCKIGANAAAVSFAGLISPGLYQLNITVPTAATSGDNPIGCTYSGTSTPTGALITVQQ
jgi:uncharacterized protein (TIGR03437 family)